MYSQLLHVFVASVQRSVMLLNMILTLTVVYSLCLAHTTRTVTPVCVNHDVHLHSDNLTDTAYKAQNVFGVAKSI